MKIAILSANLGKFDITAKEPVKQNTAHEVVFHRFTDEDFPPITGLTPRLQYRIPKLFGYEMFPGYDVYIWLDSSMSLLRDDSVEWLLQQLGDNDFALFRHPWRGTIKQEVEHIETKLKENNWYIVPRYKNGLHREFYDLICSNGYNDTNLYASNVFVYQANKVAKQTLQLWWYYQSRYFTCDQIHLPYVCELAKAKVYKIPDNVFKIGYTSLVSHHK